MVFAKVVGNVVVTVKNQHLTGRKIMVVRAIDHTGCVCGPEILAFDAVDAGIGDYVVVIAEGGAAKEILNSDKTSPIDICIAGIVDDFKYMLQQMQKNKR
jgi:Carbon dioxide concentrating mechanism/carboxysome shell protein